jgi:hypothetical protein
MRPPDHLTKWAFFLGVITIFFELLKTSAIIITGDPRNSPQISWLLYLRSGNPLIELSIILFINIALFILCLTKLQGGRFEYRRAFSGLIFGIIALLIASFHFLNQIYHQYEHLSSLSTIEKRYHLNAYLSNNGESEYLVHACPHWQLQCQTYRVAYISDKTEIKSAKLTHNPQTNSFAIQTINGTMTLTNSDGSWPQLTEPSSPKTK